MHSHRKYALKNIWAITKNTAKAWYAADPFRQSAIIAYYAIFSIPALLVIIITCAGFIFGREAVQGEISQQIGAAIGPETAKQVEDMIANVSTHKSSVLATIIGVITLILGATGVFTQLQVSLNQIWEVKMDTTKKMWIKTLRDRLFSFGLILSIGFLLLISLIITTALEAFGAWIKMHLPDVMLFVFRLINVVLSLGVTSVLFALMFKILPDARIRWRNVWIGAVVTALLFTAGKFGLGVYFGKAHPGSAYGAAGSIVLLMLWVSYSCMIVFFGAEFTKQFTTFYAKDIEPARGAEHIQTSEEEQLVADKNKAVEK